MDVKADSKGEETMLPTTDAYLEQVRKNIPLNELYSIVDRLSTNQNTKVIAVLKKIEASLE